jgi:hypothetical protein
MALMTGAEILELEDSQSVDLRVTEYELGEMVIHPRQGPPDKRIRVLRLHVRQEDKRTGPPYWDITGQTLIEQLLPYLRRPDFRALTFRVTKYGVAPKARFGLQIIPASA